MTNPRDLVPSVICSFLRSFAAGLVALGDADRPSPFGTEARAESAVDGLANAASISDGGKTTGNARLKVYWTATIARCQRPGAAVGRRF